VTARPPLSVIVPCLNEAHGIVETLDALAPLRARGAEVIVVDGGSSDWTVALAMPRADIVIVSARGRAVQMNRGAAHARGEVFLFLHADTRLPDNAVVLIREGLARRNRTWGRFDVRIDGTHFLLRTIAAAMNLRSRVTGIATGDQAIFVDRTAFACVGGFPEIALMEDIELSAMLRHYGRPLCIPQKATTSGRRWEQHGVLRTVLFMWRLRLAYYFGADPARLALRYAAHG